MNSIRQKRWRVKQQNKKDTEEAIYLDDAYASQKFREFMNE